MAVDIQSLLFCSMSRLEPVAGGQALSLLGVFGHHAPGPSSFDIFTSFRGDKGTYRITITLENPEGQRVLEESSEHTIANERLSGAFSPGITPLSLAA